MRRDSSAFTLSVDDWQIFFALAESGNFSKVAFDLGISTALVTRTIRKIEEAFQTQLVDRSYRPCRLTEEGQQLLSAIKPSFDNFTSDIHYIEQTLRGSAERQTLRKPLLKVSGPTALVQRYLIAALGRLQETQRFACQFQVSYTETMQDLLDGRCDLLISPETTARTDVTSLNIIHAHTICMASPRYLQRYGYPKHPSDLHQHCGLIKTSELFPSAGFLVNRLTGQSLHIAWKTQTFFSDMNSLHQAVLQGQGITKDLAISHCVDELEAGTIVPILPDWRRPVWDFYLHFLNNHPKVELLNALATRLSEDLRTHLANDRKKAFALVDQYYAKRAVES